jgi:superfamily I DNA/RNA helicase
MRDAATSLPASSRFSAFVVDEAQDFADSWWPALLESASTPDVKLAVFRDDEQAVFHERRGVPDLELAPFHLTENLRNANEIASAFRPLVTAGFSSRSGSGYDVVFVDCPAGSDVIAAADAEVERLLDRGWLPEHLALLTTQHRHPVQVEMADDKTAYWDSLWDKDMVFYSTVAGFKGLERPAVVLAVDGFHEGVDPRSILYAGMSRARDLLVIVGDQAALAPILLRREAQRR